MSDVTEDGSVVIKLDIQLVKGVHLNDEAPNSWNLYSEDEALKELLTKCGRKLNGDLSQDLSQTLTCVPLPNSTAELCLKLDLYVCEDSGVCRMENKTLKKIYKPSDKVVKFTLEIS